MKDSSVCRVGCNKDTDVKPEITRWQHPPSELALKAGELHLWRFELDSPAEKIQQQQSILSVDELKRAERLLDPQKKQYFILARSHLRQLLGMYLNQAPSFIRFRYNENGKPFLSAEHNSTIFFNLSHSGSWAVIAVTDGFDVGIDIEKNDPALDFQLLAARYFDLAEMNQLMKFLRIRQRREFYRLWTRKEAVLKMLGSGFSSLKPEERLSPMSNGCYLTKLFLTPGYISTVATNTEIRSICRFNFSV